MEELSIKEETIDIVRQMVADGQISQEVAEKYFPQLKESEDEKIRKELWEYFHNLQLNSDADFSPSFSIDDILSWIERQGEHINFRNKIQIGDQVTRNKDGILVNLSQLNRVAKQNEQKSVDKEYTFKAIPRLLEMIKPTDKAKSYCQKLIDSLEQEGYSTDAKIVRNCLKQMNGEKVAMATMDEQTSVWSEEDERMYSRIATFIPLHLTAESYTACITWFKSLKDRVQCKSNK